MNTTQTVIAAVPAGVGWKTITSGVIAAAAGAAAIYTGVTIDADQQQRLTQVVLGLVSMLGGGGSILFRVMAGLPTLRSAAAEIAILRAQVAAARAARESHDKAAADPPKGGVV